MMFDVAVIGAGPAGSMFARLMSQKGYRVVLIEEHAQPGDPVNCSGIIGVEAFQHFDLPRENVVREISSFRFFSPGGRAFSYEHPAALAVAVNRSAFDTAMAARAIDSGSTLMTHSRVNDIKIDSSGVYVTINHKNILRSRFVVIATGAGSKLPKSIGLGSPQKYTLGAQTECEVEDMNDVEIHFGHRIAPSNFAWVIPLGKGRAKVGLLTDHQASRGLRDFLKSPALREKIVAEPQRLQCSLLPLDTIPRSFTDRTLVIGEAAGQIKTITCGGIYYGLLAAEIGADVLDKALQRGRWDAPFLSAYEKRWKLLLGGELKIGLRMRSFFNRLSDTSIDQLFNLAQDEEIKELIRGKANFDWHRDLVKTIFRRSIFRAALDPVGSAKIFMA